MNRLLQALGLMRVSEHERLTRLKTAALDTLAQSYCGEVKAATDWEAKYKKAAKDYAAERQRAVFWRARAEEYRPDAEAMRRKRERDRDRKAGKKEGGK